MSGLTVAPEALPVLGGLAALALLLFLLASWRGHWPTWLAAYATTILTLLVAFFYNDPTHTP